MSPPGRQANDQGAAQPSLDVVARAERGTGGGQELAVVEVDVKLQRRLLPGPKHRLAGGARPDLTLVGEQTAGRARELQRECERVPDRDLRPGCAFEERELRQLDRGELDEA